MRGAKTVFTQPPSGGCVLKHLHPALCLHEGAGQPPSGGCVLKPMRNIWTGYTEGQPPSGGCVLKLVCLKPVCCISKPAAFRRLCVETQIVGLSRPCHAPAAFRRLCVETGHISCQSLGRIQPPSGGCVLKRKDEIRRFVFTTSRLQAAVC